MCVFLGCTTRAEDVPMSGGAALDEALATYTRPTLIYTLLFILYMWKYIQGVPRHITNSYIEFIDR